jgi:hypothetical protein
MSSAMEYSGIAFTRPIVKSKIKLKSSGARSDEVSSELPIPKPKGTHFKSANRPLRNNVHVHPLLGNSKAPCCDNTRDVPHPGACDCYNKLQVKVKDVEDRKAELEAEVEKITEEVNIRDKEIAALTKSLKAKEEQIEKMKDLEEEVTRARQLLQETEEIKRSELMMENHSHI